MPARAPLDIDLEDKLLYGLTPMRLAYVVLALLSGFALWSSPWAPSPVRALTSLVVIGIGAVAAWGRWQGRAVDGWIGDISLFVINTRRVAWNKRWTKQLERRPARSSPTPSPAGPIEILIAGRTPRAGASTVAIELGACLATYGQIGEWSVRQAPAGYQHKPSALRALLSVTEVDGGRVCYLDRGAGPFVVGVIPEDECVRLATANNQATVVAFPDVPASRAFRELAEVIVTGAS